MFYWPDTREHVIAVNDNLIYFLTSDTTVVTGKDYYIKNATTHAYELVVNPQGNPKANNYYEMDESLADRYTLLFNTDWQDNPSINALSNDVEVGPPIRRLRSRNVRHDLNASLVMDYFTFNNVFKPFLKAINYGIDAFKFKPFITSEEYVDAHLQLSGGTPYTVQRQDSYTYIVSLNLFYIEVGGVS